jgi:hypothetical protein
VRRKGDCADGDLVVDDERDVDGPVLAARLAELPRSVERIDDPGAAAGRRPAGAFLREDVVAGALLGEPAREELVRAPVALGGNAVRADREQELSGFGREARGKAMVVR